MIALIAGTGDLPAIVAARLIKAGQVPVICAMAGFPPDVPGHLPRLDFRLETLGTLLSTLIQRGITELCLVGTIRRPVVDPAAIDAATAPLIPDLVAAMGQGDDGTLRAIIHLLEARGFTIRGAAELCPDLLPQPGIPTRSSPDPADEQAAFAAQARIADMGQRDSGQACVLRDGAVIAEEGPEGTDALLAGLPPGRGGFLFKAPKPGQELRADMPVIGPETAMRAAEAGLSGLIIEAGGVMILDQERVIATLDAMGMYLWLRDRSWRAAP